MKIIDVIKHHHPILRFSQRNESFPSWSFSMWFHFLKNLNHSLIQWHAQWLGNPEVRLFSGVDNPLPLVGLTGLTSYYPLRVLRQYRAFQTIPPILKLGLYRIDYHNEVIKENQIDHIKAAIQVAIGIWYSHSSHHVVAIDEADLEGEMKTHQATIDYIYRQIEPELKVQLPDVPELQRLQQAHIQEQESSVLIDEE